jgi:Protein of unknown function (DUF2695)
MSEIIDRVETDPRAHADELTRPGGTECLACYVNRMVETFGCDTTLRWSRRFRDLRSPRATGLERRLGNLGGYCDCELFLNGIGLAEHLMVRDVDTDELEEPAERPDCAGVPPTSTRWCSNWQRLVRW